MLQPCSPKAHNHQGDRSDSAGLPLNARAPKPRPTKGTDLTVQAELLPLNLKPLKRGFWDTITEPDLTQQGLPYNPEPLSKNPPRSRVGS